jgi:hypothetical protein
MEAVKRERKLPVFLYRCKSIGAMTNSSERRLIALFTKYPISAAAAAMAATMIEIQPCNSLHDLPSDPNPRVGGESIFKPAWRSFAG